MGTYDPNANPAKCAADGYFYCTIENRCLPTTLADAARVSAQDAATSAGGGGTSSRYSAKGGPCELPIPNYEVLESLTEFERLAQLREDYRAVQATCTDKDVLAGITQSLITINNAMIDVTDGVPTTRTELMSTFLGDTRDLLSASTRRSRPLGTVITEVDTFTDNILVSTTPDITNFEVITVDDLQDPDFSGIVYEPSKETDPVKYSKEHETCLNELACTYDEFKVPEADLVDPNHEKNTNIDVDIADEDITTGCANGAGLFDKLMTAIDSNIDMQWKNSRFDNRTFGEFYASTISAAMQQSMGFLVQKEQLKIDAERLRMEEDKLDLFKDKHRYDTALAKAQAEKLLLETEYLRLSYPIQLAKLTQDTKRAEKEVELTARTIEKEEVSTIAIYKQIAENTMNGRLGRNKLEAEVEQTRVGIRTAKFDAILKKYQAYATKVQTEESKATGASQRRVNAADIQTKNKMASLYDQQRKTYVHGNRAEILKMMKDMWTFQIDALGAEGMVIEAIKGPELSSKLERAALDVGL